MSEPSWSDIKDILATGVGCMNGLTLTNNEGAFEIYLDNYESVVRFGELIAVALDGWERTEDDGVEVWVKSAQGDPIRLLGHRSMPPGGPLDIADVDRVKRWVDLGMPKEPPTAIG